MGAHVGRFGADDIRVKLSMTTRLMAVGVVTTVGTLAVGAVGYLQTSDATAAARTDARTSELMVQTEATQHTASVILAVAYMIGQPMPADRRQEMVDLMVEHADELSDQRDFIAEARVNTDVDAKNTVLLPLIDALLTSSADLAQLPKAPVPAATVEEVRAEWEAFDAATDEAKDAIGAALEVMRADAARSADRSLAAIVVLTLLAAALAAAVTLLVGRSVVRPLQALVGVLRQVAGGDVRRDLLAEGGGGKLMARTDELGDLAVALDATVTSVRETLEPITAGADRLAASADTLKAVSTGVASSTDSAVTSVRQVAEAGEEISAHMGEARVAAESMRSTMREMSRSSSEAASLARSGVDVAATAGDTIGRLSDASEQIGDILRLITSVAAQTNLLALNATIEAARAGDAGRSFSVVAGEVKELAHETTRATENIATRIAGIQHSSSAAVDAIAEIRRIIDQINDTQLTIAAASEEQLAVASELDSVVGGAAGRSTSVASDVEGVSATITQAAQAAGDVRSAAEDLATLSRDLRAMTQKFSY